MSPRLGSFPSRSWRPAAVVLLVMVLCAGHWAWHYRPRVRTGKPKPGAMASEVLADQSYGQRVWLAYPHQNLGRLLEFLDRPSGLDASLGSATAALAGFLGADGEPSALPAFGPFALPPSSEMGVAWEGDRLRVSARMYPGIAAIGRLAGWMAGNPWLSGGLVRANGRAGIVSWSGRSWSYETSSDDASRDRGSVDADPLPGALVQVRPTTKSMARISVAAPLGPLPAGQYRLEPVAQQGFRLLLESAASSGELALESSPVPEFLSLPLEVQWPLQTLDGGATLLIVDGHPGMLEGRSALLVVEQPILGGSLQLPRAVAVAEGIDIGPLVAPGGETGDPLVDDEGRSERVFADRFELPGEDLARRLQVDLSAGEFLGWSIQAMDRRSKSLGSSLVPMAQKILHDGEGELSFGLWLRPEPLHEIAGSLSRALESVPFVSKSDRKRWHDLEALSAVLLPYERIAVLLYRDGGMEVRVVPDL